jgi:YVTN family beta-propeller protein
MRALTILLCLVNCVAGAADVLTLKATVPLPGVRGRFDHFASDTNGHRIFVAALGNNTVEVIDTANAKRLHTITGQHKPTGIAYVSQTRRLFVANGDDGTLKVFDGETYAVVKNITGLDDADNVRYDAKADRLYVGYGDGALAIIDPQKLEVVGRIKLEGHPESFQLEKAGPRIFVNVPDAKQIAVVDREKRTVIAKWPMEKFHANYPMALDETNHRLFVGCRQPARLVVFDTESGKAISDFAISGDTDDLFYDGKRQRLYISCGEGAVDLIQKLEANAQGARARISTRTGARTSFFSPESDELYLAVPVTGKQEAELRVYDTESN